MKLNTRQKAGLGMVIGGIVSFVIASVALPQGVVEIIMKGVGLLGNLLGFVINFPSNTDD